MNEIVNRFLQTRGKFMPELQHVKQPGRMYKASRIFTKIKERIQKLKEKEDSRNICQNKLGKACFQHDMAYGGFKHFAR